MSDMENVIKGIQECDLNGGLIGNCPYKGILDLLKEHEQAMKEKDGTISNLITQIKEISQCYERVVRCKDCIYGTHEKNESTGMTWIYCGHHRENRPEDWFCASGSRI